MARTRYIVVYRTGDDPDRSPRFFIRFWWSDLPVGGDAIPVETLGEVRNLIPRGSIPLSVRGRERVDPSGEASEFELCELWQCPAETSQA